MHNIHPVGMPIQYPGQEHFEESDNLSSVPDMLRISNSVMATGVEPSASSKLLTPEDPLKGLNQSIWQSMKTGDFRYRTNTSNSSSAPFLSESITGNTVDDVQKHNIRTLEVNNEVFAPIVKTGLQQQRQFSRSSPAKHYKFKASGNQPVHFPDLMPGFTAVEMTAAPAHMYTTKAIYQNGRVVMVEAPEERTTVRQEAVEVETMARFQGTILAVPDHEQPSQHILPGMTETMDCTNSSSTATASATAKGHKKVQLPSIDEWAFNTNQLGSLLPPGLGLAKEADQTPATAQSVVSCYSASEHGQNYSEGERQQGPVAGLQTLALVNASIHDSCRPPTSAGPDKEDNSPWSYKFPKFAKLVSKVHSTDNKKSLDLSHGCMDWQITKASDGQMLYSSKTGTNNAVPESIESQGDQSNSDADEEDDDKDCTNEPKEAEVQEELRSSPTVGQCISEAVKTILSPKGEGMENLQANGVASADLPQVGQKKDNSENQYCTHPQVNLGTSTHLTKVYDQPLTCPSSGYLSGSNFGHCNYHGGNWHRPKHVSGRCYLGNPPASTSRCCKYGKAEQALNGNQSLKHMAGPAHSQYPSYAYAANAHPARTHMDYHQQHLKTCYPCGHSRYHEHPHLPHDEHPHSEHLHSEHSYHECPHHRHAHEDLVDEYGNHEHLHQSLLTPVPGYVTPALNSEYIMTELRPQVCLVFTFAHIFDCLFDTECSLHPAPPVVYLPCPASLALHLGWDSKTLPTPEDFYSHV